MGNEIFVNGARRRVSGPPDDKRNARDFLIHGWSLIQQPMRLEEYAVIGGKNDQRVGRALLDLVQQTADFRIDERVGAEKLLRPDRRRLFIDPGPSPDDLLGRFICERVLYVSTRREDEIFVGV